MKEIIIYILDKIIRKGNKTALGRWNLEYSQKRIKSRVDWANEDHCGACSQYKVKKDKKVTDLE